MRGRDLTLGGDVWIYRPVGHKTEHHGRVREVLLGPKAMEIVQDLLHADPIKPLFPSRRGHAWTERGYARCISRACDKAKVPRWCPRQLRKNFATAARSASSLDATQVLLGHAGADVTQVYAEADRRKAIEVALQIG